MAAPILAVLMVALQEFWIKDVIKAKPIDAGVADADDDKSSSGCCLKI